MKVAVISDIHGNMEALNSVLEDIKKEEISKILVLGDYAMAGPEPNLAVDFFAEKLNNPDYVMIQGNTDLMIADYSEEMYETLKSKAPVMSEALKSDFGLLNSYQKEFLKNLPASKSIEIEGSKILMVHGSPRRNNEDILPDTKIEDLEEIIKGVKEDIILCGHTHLPCGFQTTTKQTVVNAGSVGRPFTANPQACYLIINIKNGEALFEHRFVDYDREKASAKLKNRTFGGSEKLAEMLINPTVRHF